MGVDRHNGILMSLLLLVAETIMLYILTIRSSRQTVVKKGILKNFTKFIGKHLCQRLFFNKVALLSLLIYQKSDSGTGVFL